MNPRVEAIRGTLASGVGGGRAVAGRRAAGADLCCASCENNCDSVLPGACPMSPYVGSPLCLGGAECSERDESGIFWTFPAEIGGVEGPYDQLRGGWGFYLAVWDSTKASGVTTVRG